MIISVVFYAAMLCIGIVSWYRADFAVGWEFNAGLCLAVGFLGFCTDIALNQISRRHKRHWEALKREIEEDRKAFEEEGA